MAVNKNFVVKNGIEVNENLIVSNITDKFVGIGTSTPNQTLHVFGGIGATDVRVTGVSSFIQSIYVGSAGTTFAVVDTSGSNAQVGIGTDLPAYPLDIRSAVSTGQTALYVQGDARVTGDLIADDITLDQANFTNINVSGFTTTSELVVGYGASVTGVTTLGHLSRAAAGSGGTSVTFNPAAGISTNFLVIGDSYFEGGLKIRDDLDVDTNLFIVGIVTAGTVHVGTALTVAGISTFMSDVNVGGKVQTGLEIAGVTTTASSGGITTTGGDLWVGSNFYVAGTQTIDSDLYIIGIATVGILTVTSDANVGSSLTVGGDVEIGGVLNSLGGITTTGGDLYVSGLVGTGLSVVGVSTFNTDVSVLGDLSVSGDLNVTGDISYDEVTGRNLNITGIATIHTLGVTSTTTTTDLAVGAAATVSGRLTAQDVLVGNASTITGVLSVSDTTESTTKDTGAVLIEGGVGIEKNLNLGTTIKMDSTAGVITATTFDGMGSIGIGSETTPIGTGVTFLFIKSSNGSAIAMDAPTSGIATVTVTPGVSLGLAIALGG